MSNHSTCGMNQNQMDYVLINVYLESTKKPLNKKSRKSVEVKQAEIISPFLQKGNHESKSRIFWKKYN